MILKGYFTVKQNRWGKNFKTKFNVAFNPFMVEQLLKRFLSVIVCMPSFEKH